MSVVSRSARSRLVFPLDYPTLEDARAAAECVRGHVGMVKVGLELFVRYGSASLELADVADADLFLDLKLHDIPATVASAVANVVRCATSRLRLLTVHASGGEAMLRAAVDAAQDTVSIVAVTVLTSLDASDLRSMGVDVTPAAQVERLASLAHDAGARHFVCSPAEAAALRALLGSDAVLITPGVRPATAEAGDQKRVTTPADAIRAGADRLVVGRPIRTAPDPAAAADAIVAEIAEALGEVDS